MKKTYTIGQLAEQADVPRWLLEKWEREGLLNPRRFGVRKRRQFSESDFKRVLWLDRHVRWGAISVAAAQRTFEEIDRMDPWRPDLANLAREDPRLRRAIDELVVAIHRRLIALALATKLDSLAPGGDPL